MQHAFAAAQAHEASRTEVLEVMGRQAAYIVKDLDPMEALADPTAVEAMRLEYGRLEAAMGEVVDLDSLPEDAIIVKARMLIGIKNWEDPSKRKPKGRMVAMGNVLYNKRMGVLRDGDVGDLWAPVATLTGVRVVEARAAAHKRRTTGIDLVAAYTQIPMGGKRPYYIIMPQVVHQIISREENAKYLTVRTPVRKILKGWYGIPRVGADFIMTFGGWLLLLAWGRIPEEPALFAYWQIEDQGAVARRAIHHRDRLRAAFALGKNPLLEAKVASTAVDWDGAKRRAGSSTKCALMSTYVDDCTMDAKAGLAGQLWDMIRLLFLSDDPADVQRIVGLTRAEVICEGVSQAALTQETYLESFLETLPEEWAPKRAVKTNGQSTTPPDPKTMEARPCPTIVRSILGTLMYAARCTRPDLAYPVARLARFTDRWSDPWVDKELKHSLPTYLVARRGPYA